MRILFIGDIVGTPGRRARPRGAVPLLRAAERLDLVIANAENAAGGSGITPSTLPPAPRRRRRSVTLGDHIYKKFEIVRRLDERTSRICKPANFPPTPPAGITPSSPPRTARRSPSSACSAAPSCGRSTARSRAADRVLAQLAGATSRCIVVDVHAEATADKYLLAHHLKGRVTAVLGTHTHVPTADEQILPGGTAFQCDVGMTGPVRQHPRPARRPRAGNHASPSCRPVRRGRAATCGSRGDRGLDPATGRATAIRRVMWKSEAEYWMNPETSRRRGERPTRLSSVTVVVRPLTPSRTTPARTRPGRTAPGRRAARRRR